MFMSDGNCLFLSCNFLRVAVTEVTQAAVKAEVDSSRLCATFWAPADTCNKTEEAKTIIGPRPTSGCVFWSNGSVTG